MRASRRQRRGWVKCRGTAVVAATIYVAGLASVGAAAGEPPGTVVVSGPNTVRACPHAASVSNAEAEPALAADPANPQHLVAAWKQNYDNGADSLTVLSAFSRDGGAHWHARSFPGLSTCEGGTAANATDPWLSYGPKDTVWASVLPYTGEPGAIVAYRSTDGGQHWSAPHTVDSDLPVMEFDDKPVIAADPKNPSRAYVVWAKFFQDPITNLPVSSILYLSSTNDGGQHWTQPQAVANAPVGAAVQSGGLTVLPSGRLVVTYAVIAPDNFLACGESCAGSITEQAVYSGDGGSTWSKPAVVASFHEMPPTGSEAVSAQNEVVSLAAGPTGILYFAAHDQPVTGHPSILLSRSADGGATWSRVKTPPAMSGDPFQPTVAVGPGGVAIMWFDTRNDRPNDRTITADWWIAVSRHDGLGWTQRHLAGPFDLATAPTETRNAHFIGDYFGLAPLGHSFGALFVQSRPQSRYGPTDVYFSRVAA